MTDAAHTHPRKWVGHKSPYHSRKFLFAAFFSGVGTLALFFGKIDGSQWVTLVGVVLALYGAADVTDKRLNQHP